MVDHAIEQDKPNGPVAAVLLAGGIGAATLGIVTTLAEASEGFAQSLAWVEAVGPLTGKALVSVIVFFIAWLVLHFFSYKQNCLAKDKEDGALFFPRGLVY